MRADLVEVLRGALAAAAPQALRLNEAVASHVEDASGVRVGLDTGEVVRADVLIGADGLRSGVRERLFGPERPRYTGCVAWRALVEAGRIEGPPVPAAAAVWTGPGRHVVTYPVRRGRVVNLVGVEERGVWRREGWMNAGDCAAMRSAFAGFAAPVTAALAAATSCGLWAIYDRDPPERWVKGRVALLGDACHPMPPYLAQGAAMAIEDAFVLARELIAGAADPAAALVRYEAARVKRVARVVRTARGNRGVFHRPGPISQLLTYGPMRAADLAAPGVVRSRLDWLYGHDVTAEPSA
jgi:salicylate hydroxylase